MLLLDHQLRTLVFIAMQNAADNGHIFMGLTEIDVAEDLVQFDADLEAYEPEDLAPYVKEFVWKSEVDKVHAFIDAGNLDAAEEHIKNFLPDIQSHIYKQLRGSAPPELAKYE